MDNKYIENLLHRFDTLKQNESRELEKGGFSNVIVKKQVDGKLVAVKTLSLDNEIVSKVSEKEKSKIIVLMLKHEFTIGRLLNHPNIITTLEMNVIDYSITLEYCNGMDMLDYLNADQLSKSLQTLFFYFKQVLQAMIYMHDIGIAHMDLKLENIMIDFTTNTIKLIDFGQSKYLWDDSNGSLIQQQGRVGTLEYMPPEVLQFAFYNPSKVDVWCSGVVLYNLVYDKMPRLLSSYAHKLYIISIHNTRKKIKLDPITFPNILDNDKPISPTDQSIVFNVFLQMFQHVPSKRSTFNDILNEFSKLSYFN